MLEYSLKYALLLFFRKMLSSSGRTKVVSTCLESLDFGSEFLHGSPGVNFVICKYCTASTEIQIRSPVIVCLGPFICKVVSPQSALHTVVPSPITNGKLAFKEPVIVLLNMSKEFCEKKDIIVLTMDFDAYIDLLDIGFFSRLRIDILVLQDSK